MSLFRPTLKKLRDARKKKIRVSSTAAGRAGQFSCNFIRGTASNQIAPMATLGILEH